MKDYMESGSFSRAGAGGEITGVASIILNGNINQPVETVLKPVTYLALYLMKLIVIQHF